MVRRHIQHACSQAGGMLRYTARVGAVAWRFCRTAKRVFPAERPCPAGSSSAQSRPAPHALLHSRSFATSAIAASTTAAGPASSNLPGGGPQLLSTPEAGAFLVSHPLQDGASATPSLPAYRGYGPK